MMKCEQATNTYEPPQDGTICCRYCLTRHPSITEAARHVLQEHPNEHVSVLCPGNDSTRFRPRTFPIKGENIQCDIDSIYFDQSVNKLHVPTQPVDKSPLAKVLRINTPTKHVSKRLFGCSTDEKEILSTLTDNVESHSETGYSTVMETGESISEPEISEPEISETEKSIRTTSESFSDTDEPFNEIPIIVDHDDVDIIVEKLRILLPKVTEHLREQNRLHEWVTFFSLVAEGKFNVGHLAAQLFFDVIRFNEAKSVHGMRFTENVKQFWSVGLAIFHGKFIRFMGGMKGIGQLSDSSNCAKRDLVPDVTRVNFVCPGIKCLRDEMKKSRIECDEPGIMHSNIQAVSNTADTGKSYKICIDGKKLTSGYGTHLGEVNLYGHENSPTLTEKRERLDAEVMVVNQALKIVDSAIEMDKDCLEELCIESKSELAERSVDMISLLSHRIKELRELKVKKSLTLEKLMKMAPEPWQKSKYNYAISGVKTQIHTINISIADALQSNDTLGLVSSTCNEAIELYNVNKIIDLNIQKNYVCLQDTIPAGEDGIPSPLTKQKTQRWFEKRKEAAATGSTLHKALGLSTLKEQQRHYDRVSKADVVPDNPISANMEKAMKHGTDNEINAVGCLVGKVLPVFIPTAAYYEEGCYSLETDHRTNLLVVSPDGSCRVNDKTFSAVEIKCPVPGKKYTSDVHYSIPNYYICQILSEMAVLKCDNILYVCWTPESTTVLRADFNETLWNSIVDELSDIYPDDEGKRTKPKKKRPAVEGIKKEMDKYKHDNVSFLAEFPSSVSVKCQHTEPVAIEEVRGCHTPLNQDTDAGKVRQEADKQIKSNRSKLSEVRQSIMKVDTCVQAMYNALRIPAKEVIVALLSDLDRTKEEETVHAMPISYGLSGYSLSVASVRSILCELVKVCADNEISVRALSTDGQFVQICVRDASKNPLTILQLAKDTWERAKRMPKAKHIRELSELNASTGEPTSTLDLIDMSLDHDDNGHVIGAITVNGWKDKQWPKLYNPPRLSNLMTSKQQKRKETDNIPASNIFDELTPAVLNDLHADISGFHVEDEGLDHIDNMEEITIPTNTSETTDVDQIENVQYRNEDSMMVDENENIVHEDEYTRQEQDLTVNDNYARTVNHLKQIDSRRKNAKWSKLEADKLKDILSTDTKSLLGRFSKEELQVCARNCKHLVDERSYAKLDTLTKVELANAISQHSGHSACVPLLRKTPKKLRFIVKKYVTQHFNKETLNAITATREFLSHDLPQWREQCVFNDGMKVGEDNQPYTWYCQPEYYSCVNRHVLFMLDCHHLFVNARCFVCQHGISGLNVKKDAWLDVANANNETKVGLNIAMVRDLVDRQSNAMAQVVFCENVEDDMRKRGWNNEAEFCSVIRHWYMAEDEPGLDVETRYQYRMAMRNVLLGSVKLATFPPPGSHVAGMPITMFEGILTNIDRRLQLYALVPGNAYNVRAPNTLDSENMFGEFQSLDPKSTGALLADDVPKAMETASYVLQMRVNPDRNFLMRTTAKSKVYPTNELHVRDADEQGSHGDEGDTFLKTLDTLVMRNHSFDMDSRRQRKAKRKTATVPGLDKPAIGTRPVRQYHHMDSSKILPHVRMGLSNIE